MSFSGVQFQGESEWPCHERKTDLIILAAEILKNARADREIMHAIKTAGPDGTWPASQGEIDFLLDLFEGTIVFGQQGPDGRFRVAPRPK